MFISKPFRVVLPFWFLLSAAMSQGALEQLEHLINRGHQAAVAQDKENIEKYGEQQFNLMMYAKTKPMETVYEGVNPLKKATTMTHTIDHYSIKGRLKRVCLTSYEAREYGFRPPQKGDEAGKEKLGKAVAALVVSSAILREIHAKIHGNVDWFTDHVTELFEGFIDVPDAYKGSPLENVIRSHQQALRALFFILSDRDEDAKFITQDPQNPDNMSVYFSVHDLVEKYDLYGYKAYLLELCQQAEEGRADFAYSSYNGYYPLKGGAVVGIVEGFYHQSPYPSRAPSILDFLRPEASWVKAIKVPDQLIESLVKDSADLQQGSLKALKKLFSFETTHLQKRINIAIARACPQAPTLDSFLKAHEKREFEKWKCVHAEDDQGDPELANAVAQSSVHTLPVSFLLQKAPTSSLAWVVLSDLYATSLGEAKIQKTLQAQNRTWDSLAQECLLNRHLREITAAFLEGPSSTEENKETRTLQKIEDLQKTLTKNTLIPTLEELLGLAYNSDDNLAFGYLEHLALKSYKAEKELWTVLQTSQSIPQALWGKSWRQLKWLRFSCKILQLINPKAPLPNDLGLLPHARTMPSFEVIKSAFGDKRYPHTFKELIPQLLDFAIQENDWIAILILEEADKIDGCVADFLSAGQYKGKIPANLPEGDLEDLWPRLKAYMEEALEKAYPSADGP